jgi:isocitrate dehydrogenase (NAD+)
MAIPCTLIPGDGIGPDITDATLAVLEAAGATFDWDRQVAGAAGVAEKGTPMPDETLESIRRTRLALKGPLETPVGEGYRSVNVALRQTFDLYANVRPAKDLVPGGRYDDVDIVMIRENTEGLYAGLEHYIRIGETVSSLCRS